MSEWTPPEREHFPAIVRDIQFDTDSGCFSDALTKCTWFFDHAVHADSVMPSDRIRAMRVWHELAKQSPPAMTSLLQYRNRAEQHAHGVISDDDAYVAFRDAMEVNRVLGDTKQIRLLFLEAHERHRSISSLLFHLAEMPLLKHKDFEVFGQYFDACHAYDSAVSSYENGKSASLALMSETSLSFIDELGRVEDEHFADRCATLVEALMGLGKPIDAKAIAERAIREWPSIPMEEKITRALNENL